MSQTAELANLPANAEPQSTQSLLPMDLVQRAFDAGNLELVERAMALQERWEKSQQRKEFDEALANAKAELSPVVKNRVGHNNKKYADFSAVTKAVDPILAKYGIRYRFRSLQDDKIHVTCILHHRAGHYEENTLEGPADATGSKNAIQAIGSTLTYLQRYSLMQALGLAASDDDDGQSSTGGGAISDEQADTVRALIKETKTDTDKFLKLAGAPSIPDIPASKLQHAIDWLERRKAAMAKDAAQ